MIRKLLPILLALVGLGAGLGAGIFLRPPPADPAEAEAEAEHAAEEEAAPPDYVKLNNQFVVPLLSDGRVMSLVVLSLSLEVAQGHTEDVYSREPKIRDVFLQVLFDHANSGGFRGSFTDGSNLVVLRRALQEKAVAVLGDIVTDVLITEIARQDS
jgi:flagellar FliL protein